MINKVLSVILFPIIWVSMYLYRVVWCDFIITIFKVLSGIVFFIVSCFTGIKGAFGQLLSVLWLIITLPIVIIIEIPVGLVVTFVVAIQMCSDIFRGDTDLASAITQCFKKQKDRSYMKNRLS